MRINNLPVLAHDFRGHLAIADGIVYYLTPCCSASGKGGAEGVICRSCYRPVSDDFGMGWLVSDEASWARYTADVVADALRGGLAEHAENNRRIMTGAAERVRERAVALAAA